MSPALRYESIQVERQNSKRSGVCVLSIRVERWSSKNFSRVARLAPHQVQCYIQAGTAQNKNMASKEGKTAAENTKAWFKAKKVIVADIRSGKIPLDAGEMGPSEVYNMVDRPLFRHVNYENFRKNLNALRTAILMKKDQAFSDYWHLQHDRQIYPKPEKNIRGEPRWEGSEAEGWLEHDMDAGLHKLMEPRKLHATREAYREFELDTFRQHIHQMERAGKFQNYLKSEEKKAGAKISKALK